MDEPDGREEAVRHLREALEADGDETKNFHIRQALQLLDVEET